MMKWLQKLGKALMLPVAALPRLWYSDGYWLRSGSRRYGC